MKRRIALAGTTLCMVAVIALVAGPSSASAPGGKGLVSFGTLTCDRIGDVELFGPRGPKAGNGYLVDGEEVHQVHSTELVVAFTDLNGNLSTLSHSYGRKVPYTTFTCTQEFEAPEGSGQVTVTLAFVPPR
jgi:hypothetical protein